MMQSVSQAIDEVKNYYAGNGNKELDYTDNFTKYTSFLSDLEICHSIDFASLGPRD